MKLWKISKPEYKSKVIQDANNGTLNIPFGLPGVSCCVTWSSCGVIGKFLPRELEKLHDFKDVFPVPIDRFLALKSFLKGYSDFENFDESLLKPGFKFRNNHFKPPTLDDNDFIWPSLGHTLVSLRVANLLLKFCPEDVKLISLESDPNWILLMLNSKSSPPKERVSTDFCVLCGRGNRISAPSEFLFDKTMLPESEIFLLDTTVHIIVTTKLMEAFRAIKIKNIAFEEIEVF